MRLALVTALADRWIPLSFEENPPRYERARLLVVLAGAMALLSPLYAAIYGALGVQLQAGAALIEGLLFGGIPFFVYHTGRDRWGGQLFVGVLYLALAGKVYLAGGSVLAAGAALVWLLACPMLAAMLTEAKEEAEQAARLKQTLLANMSHEIHTPLNSIIGFAELIEESPESAPKFISHITTSGNRLLRTLNSILELSQLEAGEWDGNREAVDLDAIAAETARMLGP